MRATSRDNVACLPMMLLLSWPNAHMHCGPPGTWNLQKLQLELKYFGRNVADAKLDWRFNFWSSTANTWTVPWSLATHNHVESWLKFMLRVLSAN